MDTTKLQQVLEEHEGYRRLIYKDSVGILTCGIGRNMQSKGLSKIEALYLLNNDIQECEQMLGKYVWFKSLDDVRKGVMIELCFNMGITGLLQFKKTLVHIANGDWALAKNELCNSKWAAQVGKDRIENICYRLEHGQYPI